MSTPAMIQFLERPEIAIFSSHDGSKSGIAYKLYFAFGGFEISSGDPMASMKDNSLFNRTVAANVSSVRVVLNESEYAQYYYLIHAEKGIIKHSKTHSFTTAKAVTIADYVNIQIRNNATEFLNYIESEHTASRQKAELKRYEEDIQFWANYMPVIQVTGDEWRDFSYGMSAYLRADTAIELADAVEQYADEHYSENNPNREPALNFAGLLRLRATHEQSSPNTLAIREIGERLEEMRINIQSQTN